MELHFLIPAIAVIATALASSMSLAAVLPLDEPAMVVKVEAGDYVVRGRVVRVAETAFLPIDPPERVRVLGEEQTMTDERPVMYHLGTVLRKTLGPVDTGTRMFRALVPESVRVRAADGSRQVYEEGKDYSLDHDWGGLCRIEGGRIPKDAKVRIDYEVYRQRIDAIQVAADGRVSVAKGKSVEVCPEAPQAGSGCTVLTNVFFPFRTTRISADNIYAMPAKDVTWRSFIKVAGGRYVSRTPKLLREKKPVTVVCWGDSVTQGASPSSHAKCYVELLRAQLTAAYPDTPINVINAGIGGSSTESRKAGFEKEVLAHNPDLITVEFVNDVGLPPERIKANCDDFISRARQKLPNVEFIILTPHFMMPEWMGNWDKSMPAVRAAAARNRVALADTASIWANLRALGIPYITLLANLINHPNDLGHEFFTAGLMELLGPKRGS